MAGGHLEQPRFQRHPSKRTYPKRSPLKRNPLKRSPLKRNPLKRNPLSIRNPRSKRHPREGGDPALRAAQPHVLQTPWIPVFAGMTERGAWREVTSNSRVSIGNPSKRTYPKRSPLKRNLPQAHLL